LCFLVLTQCSRTLYSQSRVTTPVLIGPVPDIEVSSKGWGDIFCSEINIVDPDPQQIEKKDPDPHQSEKLDPDQFADDKANSVSFTKQFSPVYSGQ
jgi:hypothetical protein